LEAPGENLLIKLWETLADKGIGSLFKPWQIKREGKATAEVQAEAMDFTRFSRRLLTSTL